MAGHYGNSFGCKVSGCRNPSFHTTIDHRCGQCTNYGHGQIDCNTDVLKQQLLTFFEEHMPEDQF